MNFCSVPYEADYGMYADSKMKSMPQYPMNMNPGQGHGQPMSVQPLNPPQMNLQMQMPSGIPTMSSYPVQGMPLNMMSGGGNGGMTPMAMSTSTQLPIGAMAPLSSMTMMPMGNAMGAIDAPGINAVLPDLQPMSTMGQMGQMPPMQQYGHSGSATQMHQGRLTGGEGGRSSSCSSQAGGWNTNPNQMMANSSGSNGVGGGMWQYNQPMQQQPQMQYNQVPQYHQHQQHQQLHNHGQQQQHHHHNHGQQQQHQQGHRMKSSYDLQPVGLHYRDVRNGLNTPSMNDSSKFSKGNNSFNCGKLSSKVPHWR